MRIRIGRFLRVTLTGVLSAGVLACSAGSALAQISPQNLVVEVISLRYRTAQELIPILQPMVAREGSLSGLQSQLIVRTTPANLEDIKRILASVDVMPRQLLITVRQDADITNERSGATVSGSVGGEHGRVTVHRPARAIGLQHARCPARAGPGRRGALGGRPGIPSWRI
jgi:hypothetical protein